MDFVFLSLAYFTQHDVIQLHPFTSNHCHYSSWLSKALLCIHHISFNHSSLAEHLGCFHSLAIVNSAAKNISVHMSKAGLELMNLLSPPPE
jgi:hypothetical protein